MGTGQKDLPRRDFLKKGALAGAAVAVGSAFTPALRALAAAAPE